MNNLGPKFYDIICNYILKEFIKEKLITEHNIRGPRVGLFFVGKNTAAFKKFNQTDTLTTLIREKLCKLHEQGIFSLYTLSVLFYVFFIRFF